MQRVILLTLILLSAALPPGAAAAPDVTLEFWTISLQPFFTDYVNGMIATYERTHPGIRIRWVDVQFAAIEQKLLASRADPRAARVRRTNRAGLQCRPLPEGRARSARPAGDRRRADRPREGDQGQ